MSALAFAILALLLTGPVPALLARARWPYRAPRAAMVLWQAVAVAAVLSAFSSGLAIASRLLVPGPDGHPTATFTGEIDRLGWGLWLLYVTVFAITILIGVRLMVSVVRVGVRTRRRRARHRAIVDLLDHKRYCENWRGGYDINRRRDHDLRVLEVDEPLAYCLPGVRSRVVVSEGTLSTLGHNEVTAIVAHERAHLRARHDLVLEAFTAVHDAFPVIVRSKSALDAVKLLVELLADDAAVRTAGPTPLARALVACAGGPTPVGAMAAGGPTTLIRVRRLGGSGNSLLLSCSAYTAAAAILVVPTLAVAIPWFTELQRLFSK